jgi:hypothetical protein
MSAQAYFIFAAPTASARREPTAERAAARVVYATLQFPASGIKVITAHGSDRSIDCPERKKRQRAAFAATAK